MRDDKRCREPAVGSSSVRKGLVMLPEMAYPSRSDNRVAKIKCSEAPVLTGCRLIFNLCRKAHEIPYRDKGKL